MPALLRETTAELLALQADFRQLQAQAEALHDRAQAAEVRPVRRTTLHRPQWAIQQRQRQRQRQLGARLCLLATSCVCHPSFFLLNASLRAQGDVARASATIAKLRTELRDERKKRDKLLQNLEAQREVELAAETMIQSLQQRVAACVAAARAEAETRTLSAAAWNAAGTLTPTPLPFPPSSPLM